MFTDLYAGVGWTYTVTVTPPSPYVDPHELSAATTASGLPILTGVGVQPNTVTVAGNPNIVLAPGSLDTIDFATVNYTSGSPDPSVLPSPYLPISVNSSTLLCSALAQNTCVMGNGTATEGFSYATPQQALLFPGSAVTGTTPNYSIWAGDAADSSPTYLDSSGDDVYGSATPTTFQAVANGSGILTVPVYPLTLTVTLGSGHGSVSSYTASDVGGGETFTLNGTGATVATGLPLGQFQIQATGTGNVSMSLYVWIFPTGECSSSSLMTSPCTPSGSAIPVTVG